MNRYETNMPSSDEGEAWENSPAHDKVQRGLEIETALNGVTPGEEFRRRMQELSSHVVSTGENAADGRQLIDRISKFVWRII